MTFVVMLWAPSVVVASSDVPVLVTVERPAGVVNGVEQSPCSPPSVE